MAAKKTGTLRRDPGHPARTPNPFAGLEPPAVCDQCQGRRTWALIGGQPEALCLACIRYLPPGDRLQMQLCDSPRAYLSAIWETVARASAAVGDLLAAHPDELTHPEGRLALVGLDLVRAKFTLEMVEEVVLANMNAVWNSKPWREGRVGLPDLPFGDASWLKVMPDVNLRPDPRLSAPVADEPDAVVSTRPAKG